MTEKDNLKELANFFRTYKNLDYSNPEDLIKKYKDFNSNMTALSEILHDSITELWQEYRSKDINLMQAIMDDLRKKLKKWRDLLKFRIICNN